MENENAQALTKQNELLETEIELPLTIEEKQELQESEHRIQKAKELMENAALVIAQELSKIRARKLYRETHKKFEDYITDTFGWARTYGQNMAQYGDFINASIEALQSAAGENNPIGKIFSLNAIIKMTIAINELGKYLGLGNSEFNELKPIINNSIKVMVESVPRVNGSVSPKLSPNNIEKFYETLNEFIRERVEEENLLNYGSRQKGISQIAEQILEDSELINLKTNYGDKPLKLKSETEKNITSKWRSSELLAKEYFESIEDVLEVEDVSESNLGYDLEVIFKGNRRIYVEVKKVSSFNDSFKLTNNEFANATKYAEDYYVALVIHNPFQISLISNPVAELEHKKVIEQISWKFGDYTDKLQKDF